MSGANSEVVDLQVRLAHQEDAIEELGRQLALYAQELRDSKLQIAVLSGRLHQLELASDNGGGGEFVDEAPPHY